MSPQKVVYPLDLLCCSLFRMLLQVDFDKAGTFQELFPKLDQTATIQEWSVSVCSLEEVFLSIADPAPATHTSLKQLKRHSDESVARTPCQTVPSA